MKLWIQLISKFFRPVVFPMYLDIDKIQASNAVFSYASNAVIRNARHSIMTKNKGHFVRAELKMFHSLYHSNLSFFTLSSVFITFFLYINEIFIGVLNTTVSYAQVFYVLWLQSPMWSTQKNQGLSGYNR